MNTLEDALHNCEQVSEGRRRRIAALEAELAECQVGFHTGTEAIERNKILEAEVTELRKDAELFALDQDRAFKGIPEYCVFTDSMEGNDPSDGKFKERRANAIRNYMKRETTS